MIPLNVNVVVIDPLLPALLHSGFQGCVSLGEVNPPAAPPTLIDSPATTPPTCPGKRGGGGKVGEHRSTTCHC